ncbi:hypothetical protein O181_047046 [Austropuccinia psidii MF-1]|uniref:Uncharacterized protein n=1 Tax=Austropuccinia psidii MF-1 TaxID=1389203 RepID=A0A9Q3DN34_9BASI|nr:hypothetical protein [Austropuccinia psidii MF-1]
MSTPLNKNEGAGITTPQVLDVKNSQLKNGFSTSFNNLEPSMGQALLKEVPKLTEWPLFSGEGEYGNMDLIRGIDMIKEDFELSERLVTEIFNNLFTRSAHRWYIKLRQAQGHQRDFCCFVGKFFLKTCVPNFEDQLLPIDGIKFHSASNPIKALDIFEATVILPHINGNLRITVEFDVMENCSSTPFILGNDYLIMYGIDLHNNKDRYFTIEDNKLQKFAFLPSKRQIKVNKVLPVNLELEMFKSEQLNQAEISLHLTDKQESELSALLYDHKEVFSSDKEPLGAIFGHEVEIIFNIELSYPPLLRRPAYPASPKSREALEMHIEELLDLGVIRKVGHNEEVEITTPVIVAWHNGKSRMFGDFRALNSYTVPDNYPIPEIQIALTQIYLAV